MTKTFPELDFTPNPRREIGDKILSVASSLFESVKHAPLHLRRTFPNVLKNNNFAPTVRVTRDYAFLEITTKLKAQSNRTDIYRRFFSPKELQRPAIIAIDKARFARVGAISMEGGYGFSIGSDFSLCAWDLKSSVVEHGKQSHKSIDLVYVVGFGDQIRQEEAWQEFDALIRLSISDWSSTR
jgi:hypothetical protein